MMRILLTRPREDAERLLPLLNSKGASVDIEPLFSIHYKKVALDLMDVQAILFTSANGVRAFARSSPIRDRPVFAVGAETERAAQKAGFTQTRSAGGNANDLAELVIASCDPKGGHLLHAAGSIGTGPLKEKLEGVGFHVLREVLYESLPAAHFSDTALKGLKGGLYDFVLFFSPRTAHIFARLCRAAGLENLNKITALALSAAVSDELKSIGFRDIKIATRPDAPSLLALLDAPIDGTIQDKVKDE